MTRRRVDDRSSLSPDEANVIFERLLQGEDAEALARKRGVSVAEIRRIEKLLRRHAAQIEEPQVLRSLSSHLVALKFSDVTVTLGRGKTGPDLLATKHGRKLLIEAKGDRAGHISSSGDIYTDFVTLLGQILLRKAENLADEYAIAVTQVYRRLVDKALPVLRVLSIGVLVVTDADVHVVESTPSLLGQGS